MVEPEQGKRHPSSGHDLTCPKCGGQMRTYLRNGVAIDQCRDCMGIFLDPGELERLMTAERSFLGTA